MKKEIKKIKKGTSGITLIALVVTIVILIILATVSINAVLGENGLIKKAEQAKQEHENAVKYEENQLSKLEEEINKRIPGSKVTNPETWTSDEVTAVSDGKGNTVPIPTGFYYVGGNCDDGLVISDNKADENKGTSHSVASTLIGNQFVWVPVDGTTVKYEKNISYNDGTKASQQNKYTEYTDWTDESINNASVSKYGGFYIARYEAGIPETASFYPTESNSMIYTDKTQRDITSIAPVSKKGISWNYISQASAKEVSKNMYKDSTSVTSSLVDSYAWDTVCNYIAKGQNNKDNYLTDSTNYGNHYNSADTIKNVIYAIHVNNSGWTPASAYSKGNVTQPNKTGTNHVEIETGSVDKYRTKNIYDIAGNMWEWTAENRTDATTSKTYGVIRGSGYSTAGDEGSVIYRNGQFTDGYTQCTVGFRVVLYLK